MSRATHYHSYQVNHLETSFMKLPLEQLFDSHNLLSSEYILTCAGSLGLAIHAKIAIVS